MTLPVLLALALAQSLHPLRPSHPHHLMQAPPGLNGHKGRPVQRQPHPLHPLQGAQLPPTTRRRCISIRAVATPSFMSCACPLPPCPTAAPQIATFPNFEQPNIPAGVKESQSVHNCRISQAPTLLYPQVVFNLFITMLSPGRGQPQAASHACCIITLGCKVHCLSNVPVMLLFHETLSMVKWHHDIKRSGPCLRWSPSNDASRRRSKCVVITEQCCITNERGCRFI